MKKTSETKRNVVGRVVSAGKMEKTIIVVTEYKEPHPEYGKYLRKRTKYYAHDENNLAKEGQMVSIVSSRPLSKKKCWQLVEVLGV